MALLITIAVLQKAKWEKGKYTKGVNKGIILDVTPKEVVVEWLASHNVIIRSL